MKGEGSGSDLQVAVSGWENKVMGTECDEKVLWKVDAKGRVLCINITTRPDIIKILAETWGKNLLDISLGIFCI